MYRHALKNKKWLLFGGFLLLSLLFFSLIGSVSAAEFNITDSNVTDDNFTIENNSFCSLSKKNGSCHMMKEFKELKTNLTNQININVDQSKEIAKLKDDNKQLNSTVEKQTAEIEKSNKRLDDVLANNKELIASNKELIEDNKFKEIENKELHNKIYSLYDELLDANKKLSVLKENNKTQTRTIAELNNTIHTLTAELNHLKGIKKELEDKNISYADVAKSVTQLNDHIKKHKKTPQTVKCGKTTFKFDEFLKLHLIQDGKKRVDQFKYDSNGLDTNYVYVAGVKIWKNEYKILYGMN